MRFLSRSTSLADSSVLGVRLRQTTNKVFCYRISSQHSLKDLFVSRGREFICASLALIVKHFDPMRNIRLLKQREIISGALIHDLFGIKGKDLEQGWA